MVCGDQSMTRPAGRSMRGYVVVRKGLLLRSPLPEAIAELAEAVGARKDALGKQQRQNSQIAQEGQEQLLLREMYLCSRNATVHRRDFEQDERCLSRLARGT